MRTLAILTVAAAAFCCGCTHSTKVDWISVGPSFPPKPVEQVEVLGDYSELKHKSGAIGEMKGDSIDRNDQAILQEQARKARRLSAEHGADAVIIKKKELLIEGTPFSGAPAPPEYYIHARAIKYVHNLTPQELEIIKRWRPQTLDDINVPFQGTVSGMDRNGGSR